MKRWVAEELNRGLKQLFHLEKFLVRTWVAIQRLAWLCAIALYWISWFADENRAPLKKLLASMGYLVRDPQRPVYAFREYILRKLPGWAGYMPDGP